MNIPTISVHRSRFYPIDRLVPAVIQSGIAININKTEHSHRVQVFPHFLALTFPRRATLACFSTILSNQRRSSAEASRVDDDIQKVPAATQETAASTVVVMSPGRKQPG